MTYILTCNDEAIHFTGDEFLSNLVPKGQLSTWEAAAVWIPLHVIFTYMQRSSSGGTQVELPELPSPLPLVQDPSGNWGLQIGDLRYLITAADNENPD